MTRTIESTRGLSCSPRSNTPTPTASPSVGRLRRRACARRRSAGTDSADRRWRRGRWRGSGRAAGEPPRRWAPLRQYGPVECRIVRWADLRALLTVTTSVTDCVIRPFRATRDGRLPSHQAGRFDTMLNAVKRCLRSLPVAAVLLVLPSAAEAGPPLLCHPFDPGSSAVLPWGSGPSWNTLDRSYDVRRLTADTLRLLSPEAPILARMENLRRATIYASQDRRVAEELLAAVVARTTSTTPGAKDPLALFDPGISSSRIGKRPTSTTGTCCRVPSDRPGRLARSRAASTGTDVVEGARSRAQS